MNEDSEYLKVLDRDAFEDMPSGRLPSLRSLIGREIQVIQLSDYVVIVDGQGEQDRPPRREWLLEYMGDTLIKIADGGVRLSVSEALQSLNLHPPTALPPTGVDAHGHDNELIDVSEFPDWRPLLGRRIEGIDIIIGNWGDRKYGFGVLERGLQFRLEGGFSFIAAVWSEASALWFPGEMPDDWRHEIHSVTPIE